LNLLTGPQLLDRVEASLPEHTEHLFPPTETLSMSVAQVPSATERRSESLGQGASVEFGSAVSGSI
jgi:hypothetical protein